MPSNSGTKIKLHLQSCSRGQNPYPRPFKVRCGQRARELDRVVAQRNGSEDPHLVQRKEAAGAHALPAAEGPHRTTRREVASIEKEAARRGPWQEAPSNKRVRVWEDGRVAVVLHDEQDTVTLANMRRGS